METLNDAIRDWVVCHSADSLATKKVHELHPDGLELVTAVG